MYGPILGTSSIHDLVEPCSTGLASLVTYQPMTAIIIDLRTVGAIETWEGVLDQGIIDYSSDVVRKLFNCGSR